ncbi:MAG TPA: 50S ribosomal protein L4, partial [Candidatus Goldiibacteriota bacterium]|nr:50S ribosomal protein L4 [Candidatus Goldiibacteriota bacterium]
LNGKKVLFVLEKADNAVVKSVRNIRNADIITSKNLNVYDLMVNSNILVTKKSMEEIIRRIG